MSLRRSRSSSISRSQSQTRKPMAVFSPNAVESKLRHVVDMSFAPVRKLVRVASLRCMRFDSMPRAGRVQPEMGVIEPQGMVHSDVPTHGVYDSTTQYAYPPQQRPANVSMSRYQSFLNKAAYTPPSYKREAAHQIELERQAKHIAQRLDSPWARPPRVSMIDSYNQWHCGHIHTPWYPDVYTVDPGYGHRRVRPASYHAGMYSDQFY